MPAPLRWAMPGGGLSTALVFPVKTGYRLSMRYFILGALTIASALSAPGLAAPAQLAAPIKTGLWQIQTEREANGQKLPDASDRMKDMSPERRARFEAMLKQRGVAAGAAGGTQVCYTRELLESHALGRSAERLQSLVQPSRRHLVEMARDLSAVCHRVRWRSRFPESRELHPDGRLGVKDGWKSSQLAHHHDRQVARRRLRRW